MLGVRVGGRRVGYLAGFGLAVDPNLWISDSQTLSETLVPIVVLLFLLASYRLWRKPGLAPAIWLGAALGVAALARDELGLLVVFAFLPLVWLVRASWRRRLGMAGCGLLAAGVVVAPWVGWNLARFDRPVLISDGLGLTLALTECNQAWYGNYTGWSVFACGVRTQTGDTGDESDRSSDDEHAGLRYIEAHLSALPRVVAAREGRAFGLYRPAQQLHLETSVNDRPYLWDAVGLGMYYVLAALAVAGVVVLRRRRVLVLPLLALGVDVVVAVALSFGSFRFRTAFEVALVVLAAAALAPSPAGVGREDAEGAARGGVPGQVPSPSPGGVAQAPPAGRVPDHRVEPRL